jgi:hypothetical protein
VILVQAISWLFRGGYRLAALDADLAMTPPSERSRASNLQPDPFLDRCNMSLLRADRSMRLFLNAAQPSEVH